MRVSRFLPNPNLEEGETGRSKVRRGVAVTSAICTWASVSVQLSPFVFIIFFSHLFGKRENHCQSSHVLENPWLRSPRTKGNPLIRRRSLPLLSKIYSLPLASTSSDPISNKRPKLQIKVHFSLSRWSPSPNSSIFLLVLMCDLCMYFILFLILFSSLCRTWGWGRDSVQGCSVDQGR
jgi:hypothetical protein